MRFKNADQVRLPKMQQAGVVEESGCRYACIILSPLRPAEIRGASSGRYANIQPAKSQRVVDATERDKATRVPYVLGGECSGKHWVRGPVVGSEYKRDGFTVDRAEAAGICGGATAK